MYVFPLLPSPVSPLQSPAFKPFKILNSTAQVRAQKNKREKMKKQGGRKTGNNEDENVARINGGGGGGRRKKGDVEEGGKGVEEVKEMERKDKIKVR
jgi:hypothetical protein